ncbi:MAG TPA: hypothetical protein VMG10_36280 [Gemmataceae bacterium]|nr:hypothetical protein [Gemmataceae bacterium]
MKTRNQLLILAAAGLAVFGVGCPPTDLPPLPQSAREPETKPKPVPAALHFDRGPKDPLQARLEAAITQSLQRDLTTSHGFWTVFHGILGLGPSITLLDTKTGQRVNALDYIADGGKLNGLEFIPTPYGLDVLVAPGTFVSQGHNDQFVAEMVEWGVPHDRKFVVNGKDYTFMDFLRHSRARATVSKPMELEWSLVIIGTSFGTDSKWTNALGEEVRFEDLVRAETDKPLTAGACGATHRLFGLAWSHHLHLKEGGKTEGVWKDVVAKLDDAKKKARQLQNRDGSFSTNFFNGPGHVPDMERRLNTSGHIFEWLMLTLSDDELKEPWIQDAANALTMMFLEIERRPMEGGTLYHAIHGLLMYYARVYGPEKLGPFAPHIMRPPK